MTIHRRLFERSDSTRNSIWYREILDADEAPILDSVEVPKAFLGDPAPPRILIILATDPTAASDEAER